MISFMKTRLLTVCMHVMYVCMYLSILIYSFFLNNLKVLKFIILYPIKKNFLINKAGEDFI